MFIHQIGNSHLKISFYSSLFHFVCPFRISQIKQSDRLMINQAELGNLGVMTAFFFVVAIFFVFNI